MKAQARDPSNENGIGSSDAEIKATINSGSPKTTPVTVIGVPKANSRALEAADEPATTAQINALFPVDGKVQVSLPPQPLPQFLDSVFGNILKVPYSLGPNVSARADIVTLRAGDVTTSRALFRMLQHTLADYQLKLYIRGGAVAVMSANPPGGGDSVVIRSRSASDIPPNASDVVMFFQVQTLDANTTLPLIQDIFPSSRSVKIKADPGTNTLILSGNAHDVAAAATMLRDLDQPTFAGQRVARIEPVFWTAEGFAKALDDAMTSEGFKTSRAPSNSRSVLILPMTSTGQVLVFTGDEHIMDRVQFWSAQIDRPATIGDQKTTFIYEVLNTEAAALGALITGTGTLGDTTTKPPVGVPGSVPATATGLTTPAAAATTLPTQASGNGAVISGGNVTVDPIGNRLLFTGTATQFEHLRPVLQQLDVPPKQVLIEVTIAEVTLTDATNFGFEFALSHNGVNSTQQAGTLGGLGLAAQGFTYSFVGKSISAAFDAYASNNKVNILSRPRLFARSGTEAQIQVGADVPIITSQQSALAQTSGTSNLIQSIEYRQTGIILKIKPVVYGNRVDIEVSQEVSSEQNNSNAAITSPLILNRSLDTKLSVADGVTAVLGGLIDDEYTKGNSGIPILKDLPILGQAFRTDTVSGNKTDLVLLITPYILHNEDEMAGFANSMTSEINQAFRVGRGFSYTLLPLSTGVNVGLTLPQVEVGKRGKLTQPRDDTSPPVSNSQAKPTTLGPPAPN